MSTKRRRKRGHSVLQDDGDHDGLQPKAATKLPVRRGVRSCNIHLEDREVVAEWTAVGVARGLSSDADIARFLLSLCTGVPTRGKLPPPETEKCAVCQRPLVLRCVACHLSPSQTQPPKPPQQPSQSSSLAGDVEWSGPPPSLVQAGVRSSSALSLSQASDKDTAHATEVETRRSSGGRGGEDLGKGRPTAPPDSWGGSGGPGRECGRVVACGWGGFAGGFCGQEKQRDVRETQGDVSEKESNVSEKQSGDSEKQGGVVQKQSSVSEKQGGVGQKQSGVSEKPSDMSEKQSSMSKHQKQSGVSQNDVGEKQNIVSISELDSGDSDRSDSQAAGSDSKSFSILGGHQSQGVCLSAGGRQLSSTLGTEGHSENPGERRESPRERPSHADRGPVLYICPYCDARLPSSRHKRHVRTHLGAVMEGPLSCQACAKPLPHFRALYSHTRLSCRDQACGQCGERLRSGCQVGKHRRQHQREEARRCPHCRTAFPAMTKKEFDRHVRRHEKQQTGKRPAEEAAALCPQCGKVFKTKDDLDTHLTYHGKDSPFPCPRCPKAFKNKACLRQHVRFHGEKTQQCEVCGAKFFRQAGLRRHMQKHTGKRFGCGRCPRRFCSRTELQVHEDAVHKGLRPFPCSRCELKFHKAASLRIHMRTHTGEKPFGCPQCAARFSVGEALRKHMRRHTGEKPFCCEDCGQAYACQYSYHTHRKKHHSDVRYRCEDCQQAFVLRSSLNFHRKMCHDGRWGADAGNHLQASSGQELQLQGMALL